MTMDTLSPFSRAGSKIRFTTLGDCQEYDKHYGKGPRAADDRAGANDALLGHRNILSQGGI
jgi:hypothetical protein